jgi:hypothetical protein
MGGMPSMSFGSSAGPADGTQNGGGFAAGGWNVNIAGSGTANQSASGESGPSLLTIALILGAAWLLLRKA